MIKKTKDKAPICSNKGCKNECHISGKKPDGSIRYRKICAHHHFSKIIKKHGAKSMGEVVARNAGFKTSVAYLNSKHPYRKYRVEYCENRDGRLGFKCRYKIRVSSQLQVDHKNGKPNDNRKRNLQTLCANCHEYKSVMNGDKNTPGRKKLGVKY